MHLVETFISEHLLKSEVDVYCGGADRFSGRVAACADGILTLETEEEVYTYVATDKIIAIWAKR